MTSLARSASACIEPKSRTQSFPSTIFQLPATCCTCTFWGSMARQSSGVVTNWAPSCCAKPMKLVALNSYDVSVVPPSGGGATCFIELAQQLGAQFVTTPDDCLAI